MSKCSYCERGFDQYRTTPAGMVHFVGEFAVRCGNFTSELIEEDAPKRDPDIGLNRLGLILMSIGVLIALAGILIADSVP